MAKKSVRTTSSRRLPTRPLPVLTALDHVRSHWIPLRITQHGQIVLIGLDRKRFESPLPDVPAGFIVPLVTANMRRHEQLQPATEVSIFMRPQQQAEIVRHQTIPSQPHWYLFVSLPHQVHKRGEVIIFVKDVAAAIAPV